MTLPSFMLGAMLATLFGAAFHFWRGGNAWRFLLYLFLAWLGFWGGHWLATQLGWSLFKIGPLQAGLGSLGSWAALGVGYWLSLAEPL